jgi:hypothetical protein
MSIASLDEIFSSKTSSGRRDGEGGARARAGRRPNPCGAKADCGSPLILLRFQSFVQRLSACLPTGPMTRDRTFVSPDLINVTVQIIRICLADAASITA